MGSLGQRGHGGIHQVFVIDRPVELTTFLVRAMEMRAGAMFRPGK
jgi:hypothetical protein